MPGRVGFGLRMCCVVCVVLPKGKSVCCSQGLRQKDGTAPRL